MLKSGYIPKIAKVNKIALPRLLQNRENVLYIFDLIAL